MSLQSTFGECLIFVAVGQIFRQLILNRPGCGHYVNVLVTVVLQVTLPCVLVRTLSGIKAFSVEGGVAIALYLVYVPVSGLVAWLWYRHKEPGLLACFVTSSMAENIGLFFYPIMEEVAGADGVAMLALVDFPGPFFAFGLFPMIYRWAANKRKALAQQKKEEGDGTSSTPAGAAVVVVTPPPAAQGTDAHALAPSASSASTASPTPTPSPKHNFHEDEHDDDDDTSSSSSSSSEEEEEEEEKDTYSDLMWDVISVDDGDSDLDESDDEAEVAWRQQQRAQHQEVDRFAQYVLAARARRAERRRRRRHGRCGACWRRAAPVLSLFKSMPLDSILVGIVLGPIAKCGLPRVLDDFLAIAARANTFASMVLIGAMLDVRVNAFREHWKSLLRVLLIRYGLGAVVTLIAYFAIGPHFGPLARMVFAVAYVLPTPVSAGSYAVKFGIDPALPALAINCTMILSFFISWVILVFVPPIPEASSSSSASSILTPQP